MRRFILLAASSFVVVACTPTPAEQNVIDEVVIDLSSSAPSSVSSPRAVASSVASSVVSLVASSKPAVVVPPPPIASSKPAVSVSVYQQFRADVLADGQTKVLFFHAAWCPHCRADAKKLTAWYADRGEDFLPAYQIDYDTSDDLKKKYGVVYQHTYVKVDGQGNLIEKKQGPPEAELLTLLSR